MKHKTYIRLLILGGLLLALADSVKAQDPGPGPGPEIQATLGTAFTYQGRLTNGGSPVNGTCDFQFSLWAEAGSGSQIGSTQTAPNTNVTNGLFTVQLDFGGSAFTGEARWLAVAVRCPAGSGSYTPLSPRQALTAAPYALYSKSAPWSGLNGLPPGFADGIDADTLDGLSCSSGQLAKWNGSAWVCGNDGGGTSYTAGPGLILSGAEFSVDTAAIQRRVNATCATGSAIRVVNADGSVVCQSTAGGVSDHGALSGLGDDDHSHYFHLGQNETVTGRPAFNGGSSGSTAPFTVDSSYLVANLNADRLDGQQASAFASASHDHLGQTWTGNNPLTIAGAFELTAPLLLSNTIGDGLHVVETGWGGNGIRVDSAATGVYVDSAGYGVWVHEASGDGVIATSRGTSHYGGKFRNSAASGAGLYARGGSNTAADLVLGGSDAGRIHSDPTYPSSDIFLVSNDFIRLELDNDNDESGNLWLLNGADTTVLSVNENGDLTAIGTKAAAVTTKDYGQRKLYAVESPQNWFEDFGSAELVAGVATVTIEPIFAQTINLSEPYHVFLTPLGDCPLYVAEKTSTAFTVKAGGSQACNIAFDYRLVARRLGYEQVRLEPATTHTMEASDQ